MLLAAPAARAFDFRAQAPSGQWVYYTVIDDNSVKVVNPDWDSRTPPSGVLTIPATATNSTNGTTYNVTVIDAEAFKSCDGLTTVVIPEGVTRIGRMAFAYCTALDSVSLPSTLTYIGSMAFTSTSFYSTSHLNADGLLIAGAYLIGSLSSITGSITVPEGVQGLGNMAFYNCASMERVNLPAGMRFIGENASRTAVSSTPWSCITTFLRHSRATPSPMPTKPSYWYPATNPQPIKPQSTGAATPSRKTAHRLELPPSSPTCRQ